MQIRCKTCGLELSNASLTQASKAEISHAESEFHVPEGKFAYVTEEYYTPLEGQPVIHPKDQRNMKHLRPRSPHWGCCGYDGSMGENLQCKNGHIVATALSECYMPHGVIFSLDKVNILRNL